MIQAEDREKTLDAADELFYSRGYQSVGMAELRSKAGVPLNRLYAMFPSKNDIILACLQRRHDEFGKIIQRAIDSAGSARGQLLAIYDSLGEWFDQDSFRGCGFINAFGELGTVNPAVAEAVQQHKRGFQDDVLKLVHQLGGPPSLAGQLALLAEGAQTTAAISRNSEPARQARAAAEVLIDAALRR